MSIILDKKIRCKKYGIVSIKNNCILCEYKDFIYFKNSIDGKKELTNFSCKKCMEVIEVKTI